MVSLATLWAEMQLFREPLLLLSILTGPGLAALLAAGVQLRTTAGTLNADDYPRDERNPTFSIKTNSGQTKEKKCASIPASPNDS